MIDRRPWPTERGRLMKLKTWRTRRRVDGLPELNKHISDRPIYGRRRVGFHRSRWLIPEPVASFLPFHHYCWCFGLDLKDGIGLFSVYVPWSSFEFDFLSVDRFWFDLIFLWTKPARFFVRWTGRWVSFFKSLSACLSFYMRIRVRFRIVEFAFRHALSTH